MPAKLAQGVAKLRVMEPQLPPTLPLTDHAPRTATASATAPVSLSEVGRLLHGLNRQQRAAVVHGDGPLLVVAGPGTGKTRVITHRIAWLIATKRARPGQILGLTYTDKAAEEMQARVDTLVPYGFADTAIHTFHALGDRLVREYAFELGLTSEPRVLSRAEAVIVLREHLFELGLRHYLPLGDPTRFLGALVDLFGRAKDEAITPTDYATYVGRLAAARDAPLEGDAAEAEVAEQQAELAAAYDRYQTLLASAGCIDFGDQIAIALRLLRDHPAVRAEVQARYRYVLVDEFQDTNPAQVALLELLAGGHRNVTVVGDDDQAIYRFRGAALENVLDFSARFSGARTVVLKRNYRSTPAILSAARRLIGHNDPHRLEAREGIDKRLVSSRRRRDMAPVRARAFATVADEADWVAATIRERIDGGAAPREFAVLVRTNADADPVLRSLNMAEIPWRSSGSSGLYRRPEVRALLSFLRVVAQPEATVDFYALATAEAYGLGGLDLSRLLERARAQHRSLWSVAQDVVAQPASMRLSGPARERLGRLLEDLAAATELAHTRPAGEVLLDHLKRSGTLARLAAGGPEMEEQLSNVARFFELVRRQSRVLADDRLPFLAQHLQTLIEAGDDPAAAHSDAESDAVAVLTVHKAKGLEFPVVFVIGLVDGRFPMRARRRPLELPTELQRAEADGADSLYAEERRLFYVAVTRARDELYLSSAAAGRGSRLRRPSLFLAEALDAPVAGAAVPQAGGPGAALLAAAEEAVEPPPRRPASVRDERLTLSFSQLNDYLSCPLRFKLQHVLRVPVPAHHALVYGTALHGAVAQFHVRQRQGRPMAETELLEAFASGWRSEGFLSREHEEARFAAGKEALRRFHATESRPEAVVPVAVERSFSFALGRDRVRGRIDRIDETSAGAVITDYKSGDHRDPVKVRRKAAESLQLALYALAYEAEEGTLPSRVQLHFLDSGLVGSVPVEPAKLDRARTKVAGAADGIRARRFEATPDPIACGFCPFRDICPASAA